MKLSTANILNNLIEPSSSTDFAKLVNRSPSAVSSALYKLYKKGLLDRFSCISKRYHKAKLSVWVYEVKLIKCN